jgi:hypothetical protein
MLNTIMIKLSKDFGVKGLPFTERCYKIVRIQFPN